MTNSQVGNEAPERGWLDKLAPEGYLFRQLTTDDAELIAQHRASMFAALGELQQQEVASMVSFTTPFVVKLLQQGSYLGFAASLLTSSAVVAGAGVWLRALWPGVAFGLAVPGGIQGLVLNVYTQELHQRKGLARGLLAAIQIACAARGVSQLVLHASTQGKAVYESLGYQPTNEMRLAGPL